MKFKEFLQLEEGINDKHILKALFIIGVAASGKTTISEPITFYAKHIDVDYPQEYYSEKYQIGLDKNDPASGKNKIQEIGKRITGKNLINYVDNMLPMVINVVGDDLNMTKARIKKLRAFGYDVGMIYINVDIENTIKRSIARRYGKDKKLRRYIPHDYIFDSYKKLITNAKVYQDMLFDKAESNRELLDFYMQIQNNGYIGQETITKIHVAAKKFFSSPVKNEIGVEMLEKLKAANGKKLSDVIPKEKIENTFNGWFY
jgi:hypothetical protein